MAARLIAENILQAAPLLMFYIECSEGNVIVRLSELSRHGSDKIITASKQQGKCLSAAKDQIASLNYTVIIRNV